MPPGKSTDKPKPEPVESLMQVLQTDQWAITGAEWYNRMQGDSPLVLDTVNHHSWCPKNQATWQTSRVTYCKITLTHSTPI